MSQYNPILGSYEGKPRREILEAEARHRFPDYFKRLEDIQNLSPDPMFKGRLDGLHHDLLQMLIFDFEEAGVTQEEMLGQWNKDYEEILQTWGRPK